MDEEYEETIVFREILVAVDTSKHSQAALEAAASLARTMEAKIHGLFVHDETWNRVSKLPSISVVSTLTGQITPFGDDMMEDHVKLLKNRLREKLETVSRRHELTHSWRYVQGKVEEKILEAAEQADLITIGLKGVSARRKVLGSSARSIIQKADKPVLILKEGLHLGKTITVVYDGSKQSKMAIKVAMGLAEKNESTLTVLVLDNHSEKRKEQYNKLEKLLERTSIFLQIDFLDSPDVTTLLNSINRQKCGLIIIPKNLPLLTASLQVILKHINCPLLMMN